MASAAANNGDWYADRVRVYPRRVDGRFRRIKWAVLIACLAVYYSAPWLRWDRGLGRPDQAFLIDLPNRRGYFLWIEIWPQEIYYLAGVMILAAVALFCVTSLFGRLWCGYACPQTVWTDLFLWTERLIEGDRVERMRRDQAPLSPGKALRKLAKHTLWLAIGAATGGAWVMYFADAPTVVPEIFTGRASLAVYGSVALLTATTYLLAGWAREQVCTYMCPWPRFQAAMVDEHTLTVTYRRDRGEPRGKLRQGGGDCVDCKACVAVCPTGIDIRDGLQLECIGCGLCIDACDEIMGRVGKPLRLIDFAAPGLQEAPAGRFTLLRPRTAIYAAVLAIGTGVLLAALATRSDIGLSVQPDRSPLFVTLSDGSIRNAYTVKVANQAPHAESFQLTAAGIPGARLQIVGTDDGEMPADFGLTVTVPADAIGTFRALVHVPRAQARPEAPLTFTVLATDGDRAAARTSFHGPAR